MRGSGGLRVAGLAGVVILAGACETPTVPLADGIYDYRLALPGQPGGSGPRTFHWPLGSEVPVFVVESPVDDRPPLGPGLAAAAEAWTVAAAFGEVRLRPTDDLSQARAVLTWEDTEPVLTTPATCVGPVTGAASTRGCLDAEATDLVPWPRRDGGPSRVLFRVLIRAEPGIGVETVGRRVAHEMGHVLGILDHSPSPSDLMWAGELDRDRPSPADRATLRVLYQAPVDLGGG